MARARKIPASGINLFQLIYILIREYEAKSGQKALNLSLGNPDLIPVEPIRNLQAEFALKSDYELHTYAEDNNINLLCQGMVREFTGVEYENYPHLKAVPIPGIKTATALLPLACGLHLKDRTKFHMVTHLPAYDVAGTWGTSYLASNRVVWPLSAQDGMGMNMDRLREALKKAGVERPDLLFVIRPGNPASKGATAQEWKALIEFCLERGTRLVNDGAYTTLTDGSGHTPLIRVAKDYPDLEWAEMLSVSKAFSDPGARLGTLVGSKEFVEDFILIKGNTESGPVPSVMASYGQLFKDRALTRSILGELYATYRARLDYLVPRLKDFGLRPACETTAGFFTLWQTPDFAFGEDVNKLAAAKQIPKAEAFNRMVIDRAGVVGVHFSGPAETGEAFIRYAVCTDVLAPEFRTRFETAMAELKAGYR